MIALANLYTILDVSIQQLAVGLAILAFLVALAWYVSHPAHRRQLLAMCGSDARGDERVVDAAAGPVRVPLRVLLHQKGGI
jgi:hypothetical protein